MLSGTWQSSNYCNIWYSIGRLITKLQVQGHERFLPDVKVTGEMLLTEFNTHDQTNMEILNKFLACLPQWNATCSISGTFIFLGLALRQISPCVQHQITNYFHWVQSLFRILQLGRVRTSSINYKIFRPHGIFLIWRILRTVKYWQTFCRIGNIHRDTSLILHAIGFIWNVPLRNVLQIKCWTHNFLRTFCC